VITLLGAGALVLAGWLLLLALFPWGPCPRCKGRRGRGIGSTSTRWNHCRKCNRRGEVPRFGARTVRRAIGRPLD
jgi:hypothetical protein